MEQEDTAEIEKEISNLKNSLMEAYREEKVLKKQLEEEIDEGTISLLKEQIGKLKEKIDICVSAIAKEKEVFDALQSMGAKQKAEQFNKNNIINIAKQVHALVQSASQVLTSFTDDLDPIVFFNAFQEYCSYALKLKEDMELYLHPFLNALLRNSTQQGHFFSNVLTKLPAEDKRSVLKLKKLFLDSFKGKSWEGQSYRYATGVAMGIEKPSEWANRAINACKSAGYNVNDPLSEQTHIKKALYYQLPPSVQQASLIRSWKRDQSRT
jgi:DNA gyrase/topoisomerase IV subunit A